MEEIEPSGNDDGRREAAALVNVSVALVAVLVTVRMTVTGMTGQLWESPLRSLALSLLASHFDLATVTGVTLCTGAIAAWSRNRRVRSAALVAHSTIAVALVISALVNVKAVDMLGGPLNYQWLYYSDFLGAPQARVTVLDSLTVSDLATTALALAGLAVGTLSLRGMGRRLVTRPLASYGTVAVVLYLLFSGWFVRERAAWDRGLLDNPVMAFVSSITAASPDIFTRHTPVGPDDFLPIGETNRLTRGGAAPVRPGVQNVVVFVMESVAAQYVGLYGGSYGASPVLESQRERSRTFLNVYSHAPSSTKSLVALLGSRYPRISYLTTTRENSDVEMSTLSGALARRGYRTAFFFSADTRYQGIGDFLTHRQFDVIQDYRARPCHQSPYTNESSPFADGSDDVCTARAFVDWLDKSPDRPFFGVVWTMMTHYPYFQPEKPVDFELTDMSEWETEHLGRYLNGIRRGDEALGELLGALDSRGLSESTLVVVIGDHGESFGQHEHYGHGSSIYEENVHVPAVFINPTLFSGQQDDQVGGLIDIAPTIMDLLALPPEPRWQGRSLLDSSTRPRAYFFSAWKEHSFGYREGNMKYIYNASRESIEVYDLVADPGETTNLVGSTPGAEEEVVDRLAAWVQYQRGVWGRDLSAP